MPSAWVNSTTSGVCQSVMNPGWVSVWTAAGRSPDGAVASALLGRIYLLLGDGAAAEGALNRARADGVPAARLHHLFADAWLMQGDPQRALTEAARAAPPYAAYAVRVRARALATAGDVPAATRMLDIRLPSEEEADVWVEAFLQRTDR